MPGTPRDGRSNVTVSPFGFVPSIVFASSAGGSSATMASRMACPPMLCEAEATSTGKDLMVRDLAPEAVDQLFL